MVLCLLGNVSNNPSSCCSLCNCGFFGSCRSFSVSEMIRLEVLCDAPPSPGLYRRCKCQCVQEPGIQITGVYYSPAIHQFVKQLQSCFMAGGMGLGLRIQTQHCSASERPKRQILQRKWNQQPFCYWLKTLNWLFLKQLICDSPES